MKNNAMELLESKRAAILLTPDGAESYAPEGKYFGNILICPIEIFEEPEEAE